MLPLKKLRNLELAKPPQQGRPPHLSAASGLVRTGAHLYVIADDELSLGAFGTDHQKPGELFPLLPGELPLDTVERKNAKPDFESLLKLPPFPGFDYGALVAFGSGSKKKKRHLAVVACLGGEGEMRGGRVVPFDLAEMYRPLHGEFARLNIEGAVVCGDELRLFQRGNRKDHANAIIRCKLPPVLEAIGLGRGIPALDILAIVPVELSEIDGLPLTFTDAAIIDDGSMVFSSAAEDTEDNYNDGPCAGSAVGIVDPQGDLIFLEQVDANVKLEGIALLESGEAIELLLVSDADDPNVAASLFSTLIERDKFSR
jgi:hypothetical protein